MNNVFIRVICDYAKFNFVFSKHLHWKKGNEISFSPGLHSHKPWPGTKLVES